MKRELLCSCQHNSQSHKSVHLTHQSTYMVLSGNDGCQAGCA
jgi:hypothetical protein